MGLTSCILKFAAPVPKITRYEKYLFIGPHPDDIEIGAGATVAKLVSLGKKVTFLVCHDGRFGLDFVAEGITPDELAAMRKEESIEAAKALGVDDVRFLNLSDGGLYKYEDLWDGMARVIGEVKPDIIFAPDYFVSSECHIDHKNVGRAASEIAFFAPFNEIMKEHGAESANVDAVAFYMTAKPNRFVKTSGFLDKQFNAIQLHRSQFPNEGEPFKSIKTYIKLRAFDFGIRSFKGKAEGFRVLGRTHMHCLPEAGK